MRLRRHHETTTATATPSAAWELPAVAAAAPVIHAPRAAEASVPAATEPVVVHHPHAA